MLESRQGSAAPEQRLRRAWIATALAVAAALCGCNAFIPCSGGIALDRTDPIFNEATPLLFAHRGGAGEVPESTRMGFDHAIDCARANVLELDIQETRDGVFVVWHGPKLDNVDIEGQPTVPCYRRHRRVYQYSWKDQLEGRAWVADPGHDDDVYGTPHSRDRLMMTLAEFLDEYPCQDLNIEMKESIRPWSIGRLTALLEQPRPCSTRSTPRRILVVSLWDGLLSIYKHYARAGSPIGHGMLANLGVSAGSWLGWIPDQKNEALQTSYGAFFSGRPVVDEVHGKHGAVHVFITSFGSISPLDGDLDSLSPSAIGEVLDRGVDGIMTDRPYYVRQVIEWWRQGRAMTQGYQSEMAKWAPCRHLKQHPDDAAPPPPTP